MLDLEDYKNASKEQLELDFVDIVDLLENYLQTLVNYDLDLESINSLKIKGERIIAIADRLEQLNKNEE